MNTIFLTVPTMREAEVAEFEKCLMEKAKTFFEDERVRKTLNVVCFVGPLVAGPMVSSAGKVLPVIGKGLKYTPQAINCIVTLVQA